jgi:hypothetical protein
MTVKLHSLQVDALNLVYNMDEINKLKHYRSQEREREKERWGNFGSNSFSRYYNF